MDQVERLRQDVDRLQRQMAEFGQGGDDTTQGAPPSPIDFTPVPSAPANPPASNQIRNGDFSHSTNTWFDTVAAPATDKVLECAYWYSNDAFFAGQALSFINALTSSTNKTLKRPTHSTYSNAYADWSVPAGVARMTGDKTLDAPFPGNSVYPGRAMYVGLFAARRNSTIVIQDDNRISAMLYDNTLGSEDVMKADAAFSLDGQVRGTPASGTTERRYRILAETDRGYSFLSEELTLAAAPSDASFGTDVDVYLTWEPIEGVLRYKVYRHDITAAKFRLLLTITSGTNTYGDNNHQDDDDVGAYPVADYDRVICQVATLDGALSNLAVDGVAAKWDSIFLNIPVPAQLQSTASGNQVLRLFMSKAMDRQMVDVVSTASSSTLESATGEFTALDTGRIATLTTAAGAVLHGPEAITFVDATHVTFATPVASSNVSAVLLIAGGGDHGFLVDMVHVGYLSRAAYAPYFEDLNRVLASTAAPNGSNQGGIGPPGDSGDPGDGGVGGCIEVSTPVTVLFGNSFITRPWNKVGIGTPVKSGSHIPNWVNNLAPGETQNLYILRAANGVEVPCSPGQVVFTSMMDRRGIAAWRLKAGDYIMTCLDGNDECSKLKAVIKTGQSAKVGTFSLGPGNRYLAGRLRLSWWKRLLRWIQGRKGPCGVYLHNRKEFADFPEIP